MGQQHLSNTLFTPNQADMDSVKEWFKQYDASAARHNVDALVEEAHLPITVITDDSQGECIAQQWNEGAFRTSIEGNQSETDVAIENNRQFFFLSENLVLAVTEATVTMDDTKQHMRYADVLVKKNGAWKFKCMIQAGWGDMLKEYFGA